MASHVENEIYSLIKRMMGANYAEVTTAQNNKQPEMYYIDENYMNKAVSTSDNGKLVTLYCVYLAMAKFEYSDQCWILIFYHIDRNKGASPASQFRNQRRQAA